MIRFKCILFMCLIRSLTLPTASTAGTTIGPTTTQIPLRNATLLPKETEFNKFSMIVILSFVGLVIVLFAVSFGLRMLLRNKEAREKQEMEEEAKEQRRQQLEEELNRERLEKEKQEQENQKQESDYEQ